MSASHSTSDSVSRSRIGPGRALYSNWVFVKKQPPGSSYAVM